MKQNQVFATLALFIFVAGVPPSARAAETVPGSACTVAGAMQSTGGPEQMPARTLVCDGAVWRILDERSTQGRTLLQVDNDTGSCTADKTGRIRYNSGTDIWEYCDGSDPWSPFKKPLCQDDDAGECVVSLLRSGNDPDFIAANINLGVNILGVVGTMTTPKPSYTSTATKISKKWDNGCFLTSEGRIFCWGAGSCNSEGICYHVWGIDMEVPPSGANLAQITVLPTPTEIAGGYTTWTALSASDVHACAIRSGALHCWGWNLYGGLGIGTNTAYEKTPQLVSGGYTDWAKVSAGGGEAYDGQKYDIAHACAIRSNNRMYCWGANYDGQLGTGNTTNTNVPVEVSGATADWAMVSGGVWHTCAVKTTGRLYCWGWGGEGQLGRGSTSSTSTPAQVTGNATDWAMVSAGVSHTCAVKTTGRLYCWGQNRNGELGNGATGTRSTSPVEVSGAATDWATVAAGARSTCAIKTSGRLYCWGFGGYGALGDGTTTVSQTTPVQVNGGYTDWVSIDAGGIIYDGGVAATHDNTYNAACGVRSSTGLTYCWGDIAGPIAGDGIFHPAGWGSWAEATGTYSTTPIPGMPAVVR